MRKQSISLNRALPLLFHPLQLQRVDKANERKNELVPIAADWCAEEKGTLKEPVATRLVCKLADIVVRYVAARTRTRRYMSRVKGKNRKGVRPEDEGKIEEKERERERGYEGKRERKGESIQRMQIRQLKRSA